VAVVRDGDLEQVYVEPAPAASRAGNIYKGRIVAIEPSIQAAFLDLGGPRNGFLHVSDIEPALYRNIPDERLQRGRPRIEELFRRGQELLVQLIKEPEGNPSAGPTLSTYLSLASRSLVLMPGLDRAGVTRKIEDEGQRRQLLELLKQARPRGFTGFIARQAALGRSAAELADEMAYLERLWHRVLQRSAGRPAPAELYREGDPVVQAIRDAFSADIGTVWVDDPAVFQPVQEILDLVSPGAGQRARLHQGPDTLFARYGIQEEKGQRPALPPGAQAPDTPAGPDRGG
jgi:ribonuclease E